MALKIEQVIGSLVIMIVSLLVGASVAVWFISHYLVSEGLELNQMGYTTYSKLEFGEFGDSLGNGLELINWGSSYDVPSSLGVTDNYGKQQTASKNVLQQTIRDDLLQ